MPIEKTIDVWQDTLSRPQPCNGPTCRDQIVWATVVKSGRKMCFTHPTAPASVIEVPDPRTRVEGVNAVVLAMPFDRNHWATCPDRNKFRKSKKEQ